MRKKERLEQGKLKDRQAVFAARNILQLLANGTPSTEIVSNLDEQEKKRTGNETRAKEILEQLDYIRSVSTVTRNSDLNIMGHADLTVLFAGSSQPVKVQVKSSFFSQEKFEEKTIASKILNSSEGYQDWLIEERLIVIVVNESITSEQVIQSFEEQLAKIVGAEI